MKNTAKIIHWTPRIICILAILFISMFALDSFDPSRTLGQQLGEFAIHLVPTYILLLLLVLAWKWEWIGGLFFILIGLGFSPFIYTHNFHMNHSVLISLIIVMVINIPFVLCGGLFLTSHYFKRRKL